jgi:hypothetical protein
MARRSCRSVIVAIVAACAACSGPNANRDGEDPGRSDTRDGARAALLWQAIEAAPIAARGDLRAVVQALASSRDGRCGEAPGAACAGEELAEYARLRCLVGQGQVTAAAARAMVLPADLKTPLHTLELVQDIRAAAGGALPVEELRARAEARDDALIAQAILLTAWQGDLEATRRMRAGDLDALCTPGTAPLAATQQEAVRTLLDHALQRAPGACLPRYLRACAELHFGLSRTTDNRLERINDAIRLLEDRTCRQETWAGAGLGMQWDTLRERLVSLLWSTREFERAVAAVRTDSGAVRPLPPAWELETSPPAPVRVTVSDPRRVRNHVSAAKRCGFVMEVAERTRVESYLFVGAFACPWGDEPPARELELLAVPAGRGEVNTSYRLGAVVPRLKIVRMRYGDQLVP